MLHVLRHYIPLRTALLIASETVLITLVVFAGLSWHLWEADDDLRRLLAQQSLAPEQALWRCLLSALLASVLAQLALTFNELYDFRVSSSRYERAARFLGSAGSAVLLVTLAIALTRLWGFGRVLDFPGLPFAQTVVSTSVSLGLAFTLLYHWRNVFHALMRRSRFNQRLLVLGSGRLARRLTEELASRENTGYDVVATVPLGDERRETPGDARGLRPAPATGPTESRTGNPWFEAGTEGEDPRTPPPRRLAASAETSPASAHPAKKPRLLVRSEEEPAPRTAPGRSLASLAEQLAVTDIVVALEDRRGRMPTDELLRCRMRGIAVHEAESLFERFTGKIPAEGMRPSYLILGRGFVQHPLAELAKRAFDLFVSLSLLLVTWPLMLAAALAVRIGSPGPILFRQQRVGRGGALFTLLKFRSMRSDAEELTGPVWAQENDPRVTRVGRFLRHSRIDELPQLFNVLGGAMSFVGPRPERPEFVADLTEQLPYYPQRHSVKPGLTGWAQINYPYGNTVEDALQKLQYDLFYIKHMSLLFDASIVLNTVKTVVLRKGT